MLYSFCALRTLTTLLMMSLASTEILNGWRITRVLDLENQNYLTFSGLETKRAGYTYRSDLEPRSLSGSESFLGYPRAIGRRQSRSACSARILCGIDYRSNQPDQARHAYPELPARNASGFVCGLCHAPLLAKIIFFITLGFAAVWSLIRSFDSP